MIGQPQLQILVADSADAPNHPEKDVIIKMLRMLNAGGVAGNGEWSKGIYIDTTRIDTNTSCPSPRGASARYVFVSVGLVSK